MKTLKFIPALFLSVLILMSSAKTASAFLFLPPMPPELVVDGVGNSSKALNKIKSVISKLETVKTYWETKKVELIKKGQKFGLIGLHKGFNEDENKTPGKGAFTNNADLNITENGLNEVENYNAYHTLFFVYPPESAYEDYALAKTSYEKKAEEYIQDMTMEAYLMGRVTEDYLVLVEKTLRRLENCQNFLCETTGGKLRKCSESDMEKQCVFFGLQMAYVDPEQKEPEGEVNPEESENPGQYGEILNAYIVTTVYDRVVRIVENLTAIEAQLQAALQIKIAVPIAPDKEVSASDYVGTSYKFVYRDSQEYSNAEMLGGGYIRSQACANGGPNCAGLNKNLAMEENVEDSEILKKLRPVEESLRDAMNLHNMKAGLSEYKTQYKKYIKAIEIHEHIKDLLRTNDKCVVDFLDRHKGDAKKIWFGGNAPAEVNDYAARGGLSKELIRKYEKIKDDVIIGTTNECEGYYEECPVGYVRDENEICPADKEKSGLKRVACTLKTAQSDSEFPSDNGYTPRPIQSTENIEQDSIRNNIGATGDTDAMTGDVNPDEMQLDSRVKAEKTWRLGYNAIMDLTKRGLLSFKPWNDQKGFQEEYLRNKYRNIKMITRAVDKGMNSYRIARKTTEKDVTLGKSGDVISEITKCIAPYKALDKAAKIACPNYPRTVNTYWWVTEQFPYECGTKDEPKTCYKSKPVKKTGTMVVKCYGKVSDVPGYVNVYQENYVPGTQNETYTNHIRTFDQRIGQSCEITQEPKTFDDLRNAGIAASGNKECGGLWDFTVGYFVRNYLPTVIAKCKGTNLDEEVRAVYDRAKSEGRWVAQDRFEEVVRAREESEKAIKSVVLVYEADMKKLRDHLDDLTRRRINENRTLNTAMEIKNKAVNERERSVRRMAAISEEVQNIEKNRIPYLQGRITSEKSKASALEIEIKALSEGIGKNDKDFENPTLAQRVGVVKALRMERKLIETGEGNTEEIYENIDKEDRYESLPKLDETIKRKDAEKARIQQNLDMLQDLINKQQDAITARTEEFTEQYLDAAYNTQGNIEDKNVSFEQMVENDKKGNIPNRMENTKKRHCCKHVLGFCKRHCNNSYPEDDLESTIKNIFHSEDKRELEEIIIEEINDTWFKDMSKYTAVFNKLGISGELVFTEPVLGIDFGLLPITAADVVEKIKDEAVKTAAEKIKESIQEGDKIMDEELKQAEANINALTGIGVLGISGNTDTGPNPDIFVHKNYSPSGKIDPEELSEHKITEMHMKLIEKLRIAKNAERLAEAGITASEIFGIPDEIRSDEDFFVGLPARGKYPHHEINEHDGRDYMAPHGPFLNLPPVREVFYYSALDFDDTPKDKKKNRPASSYLLDVKYKGTEHSTEYDWNGELQKVEQLPELWRYLMAQPNLREDGKYQQTFIERSFGKFKIKELLENKGVPGFNWKNYQAVITRGGVYPCKMENGKIIDINGGGKKQGVDRIEYYLRDTFPYGSLVNAKCLEISDFKGKILQTMADFDKDDEKNKTYDALQGLSKRRMTQPMYDKYSELGQLLRYDKRNTRGGIAYAGQIKELNLFLTDQNSKNTMDRQKALTAAYTRNIFGSFLEVVGAEHNAKKARENNKEEVIKSLGDLCEQIHSFGASVDGEVCTDTEDDECMDKIKDECVNKIMDTKGFSGPVKEGTQDTSYYTEMGEELHRLKMEKLNKAIAEFNKLSKGKYSEKVEERLKIVRDTIDGFKKDPKEVSVLHPHTNPTEVEAAVSEAAANRKVLEQAEKEGLLSMENQSKIVPYCPIY